MADNNFYDDVDFGGDDEPDFGTAATSDDLSFEGDEIRVFKDVMNTAATSQLKTIIERIERLESDEDAVKADKKEVYGEAKGNGFDVKILRMLIRRRKQDRAKRLEEEAVLDLYEAAVEMIK